MKNMRIVHVVFCINLASLAAILITVIFAVPNLPDVMTTKKVCLPSQEKSSLVCGSAKDILPGYLKQGLDNAFEKLQEVRAREIDEMSLEMKHYLYNIYLAAKPAARYSAKLQTNVSEQQGSSTMTPIAVWKNGNDDDRYGFKRFGVRLEKGRIIVPVSGTYLVYSFLDLYEELKSNETNQIRDWPVMHGIYIFNFTERTEKEVMTSCHPHQSTLNRRFNIYSSFVMTLVDLRAGDEVMVKVNDLSLLQYPVFNSFGLNLI